MSASRRPAHVCWVPPPLSVRLATRLWGQAAWASRACCLPATLPAFERVLTPQLCARSLQPGERHELLNPL